MNTAVVESMPFDRRSAGGSGDFGLSQFLSDGSAAAVIDTAFNSASEGIIITDANGRILWVNDAFSRISGYERAEVVGERASILKSGLQDAAIYRDMWEALGAAGEWEGELINRRKDGSTYPQRLLIRAVPAVYGAVRRYVGIFSDLTSQRVTEERIWGLTYFDAVTKLPNRALMIDRIGQDIGRAKRNGTSVAVVMISLDGLPTINESLEHQQGDALLYEVSQRLLDCVRVVDTVCCLQGGVFVCVLTELGVAADVSPVISRIQEALGQSFPLGDQEIFITVSLGISMFPNDAESIADLVQKAEKAAGKARKKVGNSYNFYTSEMTASSQERLRLEMDLRKAVSSDDQLTLYYQPKIEACLSAFHPHPLNMVGVECRKICDISVDVSQNMRYNGVIKTGWPRKQRMTTMWYKFTAYNTESRYGWTQTPAIAEAALAWLNKDREITVYSMSPLGDAENEADGSSIKLVDRDDHLFTDDTNADEFEVGE